MTSQQISEWGAAGVLAGVLALYGCGSEQRATTSQSSTAATAPAATAPTATAPATTAEASDPLPDVLRGSWKRTMKARDWQSAGSGYPLGTWRFDADGDGAVHVYLPHKDTVDFTTQFTVKGQQFEFDTIPVCPEQTAQYKWRASAQKLTLIVVGDDACKQRAALFGGTWTRRR